jgi:hypothetical protein
MTAERDYGFTTENVFFQKVATGIGIDAPPVRIP